MISEEQLNQNGKYWAAKELFPDLIFDTALPQMWLNMFKDAEYDIVRAQTVWGYPPGEALFGLPYPLTHSAKQVLEHHDIRTGLEVGAAKAG